MLNRWHTFGLSAILALSAMSVALAQGVSQAFTYQGFLRQSGAPVTNASQGMRFRIYNAATGGTLLWDSGNVTVNVQNGLFTVTLNAPATVWTGAPRFLEIQVNPAASGPILSPRIPLNPTPYANTSTQLNMFQSGASNPDRMVITHSPAYTDWGLQYRDNDDSFHFLAGGVSRFRVGLGDGRIDIPFALRIPTGAAAGRVLTSNAAGDATWQDLPASATVWAVSGANIHNTNTGNVGIGTSSLMTARLSVAANSTTANATLRLHEEEAEFTRLEFTNTNTARKWHIAGLIGTAVANDRLNFWNSQTGDILSITGNGLVGIGTTNPSYALHVTADASTPRAIFGHYTDTSTFGHGVVGQSSSPSGTGVVGVASAEHGSPWGVFGRTYSSVSTAYGVHGEEPLYGSGHAVYASGTLAATGTKSFQIDHPLRPETHYLNHFCAEGPEPYNLYRGNVVTDAQGYATVTLPPYFESINRDPTYHLTVIDASDDFVLAKVVREIQNNQFVIRTSKPNVKVSWRVEAVRNDLWVQRYGFQTEQEKEDDIKGKYLHPELYGQPKERDIHYRPEPERPNEGATPK